jgi:hypothetical protein
MPQHSSEVEPMSRSVDEKRALARAYLDRRAASPEEHMAHLRRLYPDAAEELLDALRFHLFVDLPGALVDLMAEMELILRDRDRRLDLFGEAYHLVYHLYNYALLESRRRTFDVRSLAAGGHVESIKEKCERLAAAFEGKGVRVHENLSPGLSRSEILHLTAKIGIRPPEELIELYEWRDGSMLEHDPPDHRNIIFRDNVFISLERAIEEHAMLMGSYGQIEVDLQACLPISTFDGSWDVVACSPVALAGGLPSPVIRVFQGTEIYFDSIAAMLDTCIEWVSHPAWVQHEGLPQPIELQIWDRHNPARKRP